MVAHLIRVHNHVKVYDITEYFDMGLIVFQVLFISECKKTIYTPEMRDSRFHLEICFVGGEGGGRCGH